MDNTTKVNNTNYSKNEVLEDFVQVYSKYLNERQTVQVPIKDFTDGIKNGISRSYYRKFGKYPDNAYEQFFGTFKGFKKEGIVYYNSLNTNIIDEAVLDQNKFIENPEGSATFSTITKERITDVDKLLQSSKVDLNLWQVDRQHIKKYDGYIKNSNKELEIVELFSIEVHLLKKILELPKIQIIKPVEFTFTEEKPQIKDNKVKDSGVKRALLIGDAHAGFLRDISTGKYHTPFHDSSALDIVLQVSEDTQPDEIIILGDMLDFVEASKYLQRPEFYFSLQPAINVCGYFLSLLRQKNPNAHIVYIQGNHEERLNKMMYQHMLFAYNLKAYGENIPLLNLGHILNLEKLNIELRNTYPSDEYWLNDNTKVVHGEYLNMVTLLNTTKVSVIQGHLHRGQEIHKTAHYRDGEEFIMVASIPCLCHIDGRVPAKIFKNNWQEGFAYVEYDKKDFSFQNIVFNNQRCIFNNKIFKGDIKRFDNKNLFSL